MDLPRPRSGRRGSGGRPRPVHRTTSVPASSNPGSAAANRDHRGQRVGSRESLALITNQSRTLDACVINTTAVSYTIAIATFTGGSSVEHQETSLSSGDSRCVDRGHASRAWVVLRLFVTHSGLLESILLSSWTCINVRRPLKFPTSALW